MFFLAILFAIVVTIGELGQGESHKEIPHKRSAQCMVTYSITRLLIGSKEVTVETYQPIEKGQYPLIVMLHGAQSVYTRSGNQMPAIDNFGEKQIAQNCYVVALPHYFDLIDRKSATNLQTLRDNFTLLFTGLKEIIGTLRYGSEVQGSSIGIYGESYGGFLAVALATQLASVRALSEYSGGYPDGYKFYRVPEAILIQHGYRDQLVPVSEAYRLRDDFVRHGCKVRFRIYPDQSHYFDATTRGRILLRTIVFFNSVLR
jgi:dienelactone hydrolase